MIVSALILGLALAAAGLYWFQPWKLWTDETVREALPVAGAGTGEPKTLTKGRFISHEHSTRGTVRVLELPDGSRTLRLEGLDTSNGPALHVWVTDAPVKEGTGGWRVFDDGRYVDLGGLKGNKGDQNYALPASVDLDELTSVSIWCERFGVSFGAAQLHAVG
ncbi:electron transporter [Streptomyces griseochromogenes]|uniref:Electron transporter n=1 Tax=Streptomyces griseochromogenes TaxID=68214 RepID=A0A1B1B2I7_9ACTN|nr:electron transporter [Streptomyces griseochromogenes]